MSGRVSRIAVLWLAAATLPAGSAFGQARVTGDPYGDDPSGIVADPCPVHAPPATDDARAVARLHQLTRDFGQLCRYRDEDRRILASGERPRIVFMGDSITAHWIELDPAFFGNGVVDRGIGGQTTAQMLLRFRQDVIDLAPRAVHIMAGTNDIAGNGGATTIDGILANIATMADLARAHGIRVIIGSVPPATGFYWSPDKRPAPTILSLNARLAAYAAANGFAYVDYHRAMAAPDGTMRAGLSSDGTHPTIDGYRLMRPLAEVAIGRVLGSAGSPSPR